MIIRVGYGYTDMPMSIYGLLKYATFSVEFCFCRMGNNKFGVGSAKEATHCCTK